MAVDCCSLAGTRSGFAQSRCGISSLLMPLATDLDQA